MGIRVANDGDWHAVSEISTACGYDDYINAIGPSYMDDGVLIVYEKERIYGFGKINYLDDGSAWLSGLRVHADAWRSGVGFAISQHLLHMALKHGCTAARMLIEDRNTRSVNLSLKMGFMPLKSYSFFEGTPKTTGWKNTDFTGAIMVNEGWSFVELNDRYRGKGKFMESQEKTLGYVWGDNTELVQIVRSGEDLNTRKEGITCIPKDDSASLKGKFEPLNGFESATVYTMKLPGEFRKTIKD